MEMLNLEIKKNKEPIEFSEHMGINGTWIPSTTNTNNEGTFKQLNYLSHHYLYFIREFDGEHTIYRVDK